MYFNPRQNCFKLNYIYFINSSKKNYSNYCCNENPLFCFLLHRWNMRPTYAKYNAFLYFGKVDRSYSTLILVYPLKYERYHAQTNILFITRTTAISHIHDNSSVHLQVLNVSRKGCFGNCTLCIVDDEFGMMATMNNTNKSDYVWFHQTLSYKNSNIVG